MADYARELFEHLVGTVEELGHALAGDWWLCLTLGSCCEVDWTRDLPK